VPTVVNTTIVGVERRPLTPATVTLGRYLLEDRIGRGGMGEVFRAHDPELDRSIAIKRLMSFVDDDQAQIRMLREGQAIAKLSHPHVVQVYDVGRDPATGDMFIAMELVEGVTLRQWLRSQPTWREIADVFVQAGTGLLAAHEQGIVHRDFKPENVLVARGPIAKVADFGLAKPASIDDAAEPMPLDPPRRSARVRPSPQPPMPSSTSGRSPRSSSAFDSELTPAGARLGTPAYMAPEQASGATTPRADQFSFAVAVFEALAGYLPFPGDNPAQYAVSVLDGAMLEFPRRTPVPGRLQEAIYRALDPDPNARFPTLAPLLDELRRDPAALRRRAMTVGATLGLGAAVALVGAELTRRSDIATSECDAEARLIATVWNDEIRDDVEQAIAGVAVPYAADTASRTIAALDRTTAAWSGLRTRWCETTRFATTPTAVDAAIGACSDRMLSRQRELVSTLVDADPDVLTNALDAIEKLERELAHCEDPAFLAQHAGDATEDRRAALEVLAQTRQRLDLGQTAAGLRTLDALVLRDDPIIALEHLLLRASLEKARGNLVLAKELLDQAAHTGLGADAPLLAAEWNVGYGGLLYEMGELDEIAAPFERAWSLRRHHLGDDHILTLVSLAERGHLPYARGDYEAALAIYRDAADRAAASVPETDYDRILIDEWVAQAMSHMGALDAARERTADLVQRLEKSRGATHPRTLDVLETQATIELRSGLAAAALEHFQQALRGRAPLARGGDPLARAATLANIGACLSELERHDDAIATLNESLDLWRQAGFGPENPSVIAIESNLATLQHKLGRLDAALAGFGGVLEHMHAAGLDLTSDGLMIHINYANVLEDVGRRADAIVALRTVVERARLGSDPVLLGRAAQAYAQLLDRHGDRDAADLAIVTASEAFADLPADSPWRVELERFRRSR
jgi:tetratricopeptide (TPR) repeat protein